MINTEVNSIDEIINIIKTSKKQIYRFDTDSSKNTALKKEALNNLQKFKNFCELELNLSSKNIDPDYSGISSEYYKGSLKISDIMYSYRLISYNAPEIRLKLLIFNMFKNPQLLEITYQLWVGNDRLISTNDFNVFESKFKEWLEEDN